MSFIFHAQFFFLNRLKCFEIFKIFVSSFQGRREEAVSIVAKGVKWNGSGIPLDKQYYLSKAKYMSTNADDSATESAGLSDLFKTSNLRMKTLNVCLCWFANALAYYGLSLSSGKLSGNPYLILFIMGQYQGENH